MKDKNKEFRESYRIEKYPSGSYPFDAEEMLLRMEFKKEERPKKETSGKQKSINIVDDNMDIVQEAIDECLGK